MTLTAHSIVGATAATLIPNPAISLPLCLLLHFATDKIPHWDTMTDKTKSKSRLLFESIIDMATGFLSVAVIFGYFLHAQNLPVLFLAVLVSQLPDLLEFPYIMLDLKIPLFYDDYRLQHWIHDLWFDARLKAPWGIISQGALVALSLLLLNLFHPLNVLAGLGIY